MKDMSTRLFNDVMHLVGGRKKRNAYNVNKLNKVGKWIQHKLKEFKDCQIDVQKYTTKKALNISTRR